MLVGVRHVGNVGTKASSEIFACWSQRREKEVLLGGLALRTGVALVQADVTHGPRATCGPGQL